MWTISGFADEIAPELAEQCAQLRRLGLAHLELRSVGGTNVADLTDAELDQIKATVDSHGIGVTCIGAPVGKSDIAADFAVERARLDRCLRAAVVLGSPLVRVFSFRLPEGDDPATHRAEVVARMTQLADAAAAAGVRLVHENETRTYGDIPQRCADLIEAVGSPALRATWDPANFVQAGVRPFTDAYPILRPHLIHLQIKDRRGPDNVPAGQGDGQIPATVAALRDSGFDGVFSLEPHLSSRAGMIGFSGPELFATATESFTGLLEQAGVAWS